MEVFVDWRVLCGSSWAGRKPLRPILGGRGFGKNQRRLNLGNHSPRGSIYSFFGVREISSGPASTTSQASALSYMTGRWQPVCRPARGVHETVQVGAWSGPGTQGALGVAIMLTPCHRRFSEFIIKGENFW